MTMLSDRPQATVRSAGPVSDAERLRLEEAGTGTPEWRDWGPYLSERAWGTVREDYSADGDAWSFFPHEHARSRVYRWNEDGMAGFSDETQNWCLSLGLWNGVDSILKERMFGLTGPQGNHGEDVKEYWWYLDGTPHAFLAHLALPLPAAGVPLRRPGRRERPPGQAGTRIRVGRHRCIRRCPVLGGHRRLRQGRPRDLLMKITVENAGPDEATLHVLLTFWFRNTWSWWYSDHPKPSLCGSHPATPTGNPPIPQPARDAPVGIFVPRTGSVGVPFPFRLGRLGRSIWPGSPGRWPPVAARPAAM